MSEIAQGRVSTHDARVLLCHGGAFGKLRKELVNTLGWRIARGVLMRYGYHRGTEVANILGERYPWDNSREWLLAGMKYLTLKRVATVSVESINIDEETRICRAAGAWRDCYEAEDHLLYLGQDNYAACWVLTSFLAGYASLVVRTEMICIENTCVAKGDDLCRWELREASAWGPEADEAREALHAVDLSRHMDRLARNRRLATMSTYTAGLAHELKNPLNSASIQLQLLERILNKGRDSAQTALEAECLQITEKVREEIQRLTRLVEDFILFARPRSAEPRPEPLADIIKEVCQAVSAAAKVQGISISCEISSGLAHVSVDREKIREAIYNLVTNAIEAMPDGGTVRINACKKDGMAEVTVSDNGPGIPESVRPQVFDVFFSTKEMGTGLGLPIAHRIIEEHGGSLELESTGPDGTTFAMRLPFA